MRSLDAVENNDVCALRPDEGKSTSSKRDLLDLMPVSTNIMALVCYVALNHAKCVLLSNMFCSPEALRLCRSHSWFVVHYLTE